MERKGIVQRVTNVSQLIERARQIRKTLRNWEGAPHDSPHCVGSLSLSHSLSVRVCAYVFVCLYVCVNYFQTEMESMNGAGEARLRVRRKPGRNILGVIKKKKARRPRQKQLAGRDWECIKKQLITRRRESLM